MNPNNFCIIMAGGFGSRFWPICSLSQPKQFIDLMGSGISMIQDTFQRFEAICPRENIFIVTAIEHEALVRQQIPNLNDNQILCEPFRRNTAPCVAFAAATILQINPNANIVVTPSDHAIFHNERFVSNVNAAINMANRFDRIVTIGALPVNPEIKYGYIQFRQTGSDIPLSPNEDNALIHKAITFTEKPPLEMALQFINSGEFLWNTGIYIWRLPVLMAAYDAHLPHVSNLFFHQPYDSLINDLTHVYEQVETVSIDYGIIEKAENVYVLEAEFGWSDVETWNSLHQTSSKDSDNNAVSSGQVGFYDSHNCVVHLPRDRYAIVCGLDGYIIAEGNETLLICPRSQEEQIVKYSSDVELMKIIHKHNIDNK